VSGKGAVYGARYTHALAKRGSLESRLVYGVDYKAYKNDVMFGGQNFGNDVTVRPLSIGWAASSTSANGDANVALTVLQNISGGPRGDTRDFAAVRSGAKAGYTMLRFSAAFSNAIGGDWQTRLLLNGQATGDALVPGEQFGAGGSTTVRGFGERDLATDAGVVANVELYTPNLCTRAFWQCRLLGFYDSAWGQRNHILPGELRRTEISSAGLGLRFAAGAHTSVQLDYGHAVHTGEIAATSKNKLHVRVGLAY
jgi:hemolysin activation/secretion protein